MNYFVLIALTIAVLLWTSINETFANVDANTNCNYNSSQWSTKFHPYKWNVSKYIPRYWWWNRWMPYPTHYFMN